MRWGIGLINCGTVFYRRMIPTIEPIKDNELYLGKSEI